MSWMTVSLTDGTTTLNFADNSEFALVQWSPGFPVPKRGQFGDHAAYEPVRETITFNMFGPNIYDNMSIISDFLEQVRDESTVITFKVQLTNSALLSPVEAVLLHDPRSPAFVNFGPNFAERIFLEELQGVKLSFTRRGTWTGDRNSNYTYTASENPEVMAITMNETAGTPSPTKITISGFTTTQAIGPGYIIITDNTSPYADPTLTIIEADDASWSGGSLVTESTAVSLSSQVRRVAGNVNSTLNNSGYAAYAQAIRVFVSVRNWSTTVGWSLNMTHTRMGQIFYSNKVYLAESASGDPVILDLGTLTSSTGVFDEFTLEIRPIDGSASDYLSIDTVVLVPITPDTKIIPFDDISNNSVVTSASLIIDPDPLGLDPEAYLENGSSQQSALTAKTAVYPETKAKELYMAILATQGEDYVATQYGTATILSLSGRLDRWDTYLVPK